DLPIDEDDLAGPIDHHHAVRRRLYRRAESRVRLLPGRDVHDGGEDEPALVLFDRVQTDFDGDLGAVLAETEELSPRSHRPGLGSLEESGAEPGMPLPESLRHQPFDSLPEQLFAVVSEQPLDLSIDEDDLPASVDH